MTLVQHLLQKLHCTAPFFSVPQGPRMPDCLFCRLTKSNPQAILETPEVVVLVDRYPYSRAHLLIIPRAHHTLLHELPDTTLTAIITTAKRLALALNLTSYNLLQNNTNGQAIPHVHLHLIAADDSGRFTTAGNTALTLDDAAYGQLVSEIRNKVGNS